MTIIGITGHSGSGKSKFAKVLCESLCNSILICADDFMYESVKYHQQEFRQVFGVTSFEGGEVENFRQAVVKAESHEWQKYLNIILPYLDSKIEKSLADANMSVEYAVIEWFHLPFTTVWKHLDYRIIIAASNQSIRHNRLLARMYRREQYRQYSLGDQLKSIKMKDDLSFMSFNDLKDCTVIENNYDESFQSEAVQLAQIICKAQGSDPLVLERNKKICIRKY